ncbi:MAG: tRNA lysidine(34) synthetase TilS [Cardiobacteriaceae bacterium]|nr:tRNA lysidine(34) synthetase TilS [Cardiobacteriaceae bacterium]
MLADNYLEKFLSWQEEFQPSEYLLACSGGCDSAVLLRVLFEIKEKLTAPVRVVYINHGWSEYAESWGMAVEKMAADCGFSFFAVRLNLSANQNAEAVARAARYRVFSENLSERGVLLTAHHQDDQAETFLINLLRASGLDGLSAMPKRKKFGLGEHWRPFLDISRAEIEEFARARNLQFVEDPSNADEKYLRNRIRKSVLAPLNDLQATRQIAKAAELLADARMAQEYFFDGIVGSERDLHLSKIRTCPEYLQLSLIRYWLAKNNLPPPPNKRLCEFVRQVWTSELYCQMTYAEKIILKNREKLQILPEKNPATVPKFNIDTHWEGIGRLKILDARDEFLEKEISWHLFPIQGRFLSQDGKSEKIKELFRKKQIAPILRRRLPILRIDGEIAWIGDIGNSRKFPDLKIVWEKE